MNPNPEIIKTKQHFTVLDGLRGIAALAVVLFHFMEMAIADYSKNFIGHGFLAVDFFFCLSGFVIGYAYDDRIKKIGLIEFFKSRIIRLHPLVILGSVLGLLTFLFDPFGGQAQLYKTGRIILIFISSVFLIPFPTMPERAYNLFSFNAPSWSLFWEYIANIFYAFFLSKVNQRWLFLLIIISASALFLVDYQAENLMGGWGKDTFWHGCARIGYSFSAGLFIYRSNWIIKNKLGFVGLSILLIPVFIMPYLKWNWLAELLVVLFYFPLIIALGAGTTVKAGLKKICTFSGNISYPIYMTHYAVIWMFSNYYNSYKPGTTQLFYIITGSIILLVGFAYLVMVFYDMPVRKYLSAKRNKF